MLRAAADAYIQLQSTWCLVIEICSSVLMHCYNIVCADSVHIWISTKASAP